MFVPLDRIRMHPNADKRVTYRWCNDYRFPDRLGGRVVTDASHTTPRHSTQFIVRWWEASE